MDIVIVDDEPLARQRLSKMVSGLSYDVVAEASLIRLPQATY